MTTSIIEASFSAGKEEVWEIVTDNTYSDWRSDLSRIEISEDGKSFTEYTKNGFPTQFTITKYEPYSIYEFDISNKNMSGHWSGIFSELDGKTVIKFTENAEVKNPIMKLLVKSYLKKQQKKYIEDLKKALEKKSSTH